MIEMINITEKMKDNIKSLLKLMISIGVAIGFIYFLIWISKGKVIVYKDNGTYERIK